MGPASPPPWDPAQVYARHKVFVWRVLWRRLGLRRPLVDDVFQEVFERVVRYRGPAPRNVEAWLFRCALNVTINAAKKRRETLTEEPDMMDESPSADPERRRMMLDEQVLLGRLLDKLPPEQRAAVTMRDIEGLSLAEIGATLGIAERTARKRYDRGRRRLEAEADREGRRGSSMGFTLAGLLEAGRDVPPVPPSLDGRVLTRIRSMPSPPRGPSLPSRVGRLVARLVVRHGPGAAAGAAVCAVMLGRPAPPAAPASTVVVQPAPTSVDVEPSKAAILTSDSTAASKAPAPAAPAMSPARASTDVDDEDSLLLRARRAARDGHKAEALDALDEHARRFPQSDLARTRERIREQILNLP